MKRGIQSTILATMIVAVFALPAGAQGPGPGGPGGFQPSPQMMAAFQKMRAWRKSHPNIVALGQTLRGLEQIEQDPKTALSKPQAKAVLAILAAWSKKPVMTDAQARKVNQQITTPLSLAQLQKLATLSQRHGGGRPGGFGGGPGGPGGGRGGPGGGPGGPPPVPHDYNPLNPSTMPMERMRARSQQNLDQLIAALKATKK